MARRRTEAREARTARLQADADEHARLYPEHIRLAAVSSRSQAVGEFLDWLENEHSYVIAEYGTGAADDDRSEGRLYPVQRTIESWLAQYFRIDPTKIEREKRAMLDAMRAATEAAGA